MKKVTMVLGLVLTVLSSSGQDSIPSTRKHIIKLVLTPSVIYSNAYVLSYERVMKENQTLNVTGGSIQCPQLFSSSRDFAVDRDQASGFMVGADYRFYLKKENKHATPHGVYIAPFISYYHFNNDRDLKNLNAVGSTELHMTSEVGFLNVGGQIGYQFVVNDRWTFDFIFFGPSISNYKLNIDLQGTATVDQENEIIKEILEKFPLLDKLVDGETLTVRGDNSRWGLGYRFTAMVGYKFGGKGK